MKVITYNLNGIRSAMSKGFADWLKGHQFDVICLQELKASPEQVEQTAFTAMGYHMYWYPAQKKGYSGVAIFSKKKPDHVEYGCGNTVFDSEGRVIRCDFGDISVFSIYFPSGTTGALRQEVKYRFLDFIFLYLKDIAVSKKLIVCGDYNIAHKEIDIHNPKGNKDSSGFLPEERAWMDKYFSSGFHDVFRHVNADPHQYTWWSFRANSRSNNKGWRIDYIAVTDTLLPLIRSVAILPDALHSDHCPALLDLDLEQAVTAL